MYSQQEVTIPEATHSSCKAWTCKDFKNVFKMCNILDIYNVISSFYKLFLKNPIDWCIWVTISMKIVFIEH